MTTASPPPAVPQFASLQAPPACPRCNYDLSGQIAAWSDSCPLQGTCPECGLEFAWRDILNPVYAILPRLFEHAGFERPRAFRTTLLRTLRPHLFWRWLQLHHHVQPKRLALFLALALATTYTATILLFFSWTSFHFAFNNQVRLPTFQSKLQAMLNLLLSRELLWPFGTDWAWASGPTRAYLVFRPLELLALLIPLLMPLAFVALPETLRRARVRRRHLLRVAAYSLVLLPFLVYAPELIRGLGKEFAFYTANWTLSWRISRLFDHYAQHARLAAVSLFVLFWWRAAAKHYLRLPHATPVALATYTITLLAAAIALLALAGAWFTYDLV
jgi:hypothetical protein